MDQIIGKSVFRRVKGTIDEVNLLKRKQIVPDSSMSTEYLVIDCRSKGQQTEQLTYFTPHFRRPKVLNNFLIQQTPMHIFYRLITSPHHKETAGEPNLIN